MLQTVSIGKHSCTDHNLTLSLRGKLWADYKAKSMMDIMIYETKLPSVPVKNIQRDSANSTLREVTVKTTK